MSSSLFVFYLPTVPLRNNLENARMVPSDAALLPHALRNLDAEMMQRAASASEALALS